MTNDKIPIAIFRKDHPFLVRQKKRLRKDGLAAVIESIVALIKHHKLEGELK